LLNNVYICVFLLGWSFLCGLWQWCNS